MPTIEGLPSGTPSRSDLMVFQRSNGSAFSASAGQVADLGAASNASAIAIADAGGYFAAVNVEDALQEIASQVVNISSSDVFNVLAAGTQTAGTQQTILFSNGNNITFGLSGSVMTASVDPSGGLGGAGLSAGTQSVASGTVIFANSNGLTFGMSGSSQITASHNGLTTAAQSNHSHGNPTLALTNLGGTTASASNGLTLSLSAAAQSIQTQGSVQILGSSGAISFANSNGITFGGNASTVTASHNGLTTAALSNHSHGNPTLALTNLTGTTASNSNGLTLSLSAADPSAGGGVAISGGTQLATSGTVNFANSNGITFGMSGTSQMTASHNGLTSQSGQAVSAGNGSSAFQTLSMVDAGGVTWSTVGGGLQASVKTDYLTTAAASNHSHGNPTLALTNLTGTTASASNGLTLSLSAAAQIAQTAQSIGMYASSQTFGQSSSSTVDARSLSIVGSGGVSVGMSAGSLLISGQTTAAQTAQTVGVYGSSQTYGQSSSSTVDARSISIVGSGGVSVGMSAGSVLISGQSTNGLISAINVSGGTTSNNLSKITFADGNGVSFGLNGSVMTASVAAVAGAQTGISGIANSQTTFTSGTVSFGELGAITIRSTTGNQLQFSVAAQTNQSIGIYGSSQTYGQSSSSTIDARSLTVVGSGGVSVGMSAGSLLISGQTTAAQTNQSLGLFATGNTTQNSSTTLDARSITFNGLGAASVGFSNGSMQISVPVQTAQTQSNVQGIIVSDTTYRTGDVSFKNANGISFGSSGANVVTASYTVPGATVFSNSNNVSFGLNGSTVTATASFAQSVQSMGIYGSSQTYGQSSSSTVDARSLTVVGSGGISVGMSAGSLLISGQTTAGATVFSNSNNVSFGLNGSTVTATATFAQTVQSMGLYASSQTYGQSSSSTVDARSLSIVGSGGVSVGMSAGSLLISGQTTVAQSNQTQSNVQGIIVSDTTYRTGDVSFKNANGISFGSSGANVVTASYTVPTQSAQTIGVYGSSNTTGQSSSSTVDARSLSFRGMGVASVGLSAGEVIISVPSGAADGVNIIAAGTRTATTNGTVIFSNANGISFGLDTVNGSQVTASYTVPTQTAQTVGIYASSQTYGQSSSSTIDARSLSVVGSGGVSVGMSAGSLLISGQTTAAQTVQSIGIYGSSQTYGQSSSSTVDARSLSIVGSGGVSVGMSAGSILISGQTTLAQSAQTQSNVQGIIVSDTTYRTGDVSFKNANGISFGSSGANVVTASYTVPSTAGLLSAINLSAGTTSNNLSAMVFSNSNGISFGLNGSTVTAQHNALTTARASNDAIGLNTAQTNVTWTVNSSGLSLNAAGYAGTGTSITGNAAITLNSNGLQFNGASLAGTSTGFTGANISASLTHNSAGLAMSMSVQPPGAATLTAYAVSNTTQGTSGTIPGSVLSFHADGGISVGISNGSVVISGPAVSSISVTGALSASSNGATISLGVGTVTWNAASNTTNASTGTVDLGNLTVKGAGGVSAGISNGSLVISGGAGAGMGISAGTQSVSTGTVNFANSNGITFGMSGSSQVTASYNSTQFAGLGTTFQGNNASGSMTLNSAGLNLSVSVAAPGAAAENNNHILLGANTAGNTTASGSTIGLSGLNLTLSGTNGSQIVVSAPATSSLVGVSGIGISTNGSTVSVYNVVALSRFIFEPPGASSAGSAMTQGSMSFQRVFIPQNMSVSRVDVPCMISLASSAAANTGVLLISSGLVVYSVSGTSTLNPIVGAFGTTTYSHASNTANFNSITGPRYLSFPIGTVLTAGEYYIGVQLSTNNNSSIGTATTALAATISIQHGAIYTASQWQEFGAVTATSINMRPFVGVAASVTATGQTQQLSNITQTGTALVRANIPVIFRNF